MLNGLVGVNSPPPQKRNLYKNGFTSRKGLYLTIYIALTVSTRFHSSKSVHAKEKPQYRCRHQCQVGNTRKRLFFVSCAPFPPPPPPLPPPPPPFQETCCYWPDCWKEINKARKLLSGRGGEGQHRYPPPKHTNSAKAVH